MPFNNHVSYKRERAHDFVPTFSRLISTANVTRLLHEPRKVTIQFNRDS